MDLELIISISFAAAIILESIILLKSFFTDPERKIFTSMLFRFLSNSFIYISALVGFITVFGSEMGLNAITISELQELTFGQFAIWTILIADIVTLVVILFGAITKIGTKEKETTKRMIDQEKAQDLT